MARVVLVDVVVEAGVESHGLVAEGNVLKVAGFVAVDFAELGTHKFGAINGYPGNLGVVRCLTGTQGQSTVAGVVGFLLLGGDEEKEFVFNDGSARREAHGTGEGVIHIDGHIPDFGAEEVLIAVKNSTRWRGTGWFRYGLRRLQTRR